ncbi:MAG: hypothetical protein IKI10_03510 [Muribaculaceae bacterium]|nr:hypothetical protein [Muribaculaceae bacterium]
MFQESVDGFRQCLCLRCGSRCGLRLSGRLRGVGCGCGNSWLIDNLRLNGLLLVATVARQQSNSDNACNGKLD